MNTLNPSPVPANGGAARRVIDCACWKDPHTGERTYEVAFECGHSELTAFLPNGFPSTESVTDSTLGCLQCVGQ